MTAVFISGASGFIGRHLLPELGRNGDKIIGLSRNGAPSLPPSATGEPAESGIRWVKGSLNDPSSYAAALGECDTVIHLAARTGKSPRSLYRRINVEGTGALLQAAAQAGVRRFLHMSTIAAVYPDKAAYHYARSKAESEAEVQSGSVPFTILRPTIIFGGGSAVEAALARLAGGGRPMLFGDGRARLQPVHVSDVVAGVVAILKQGLFDNEAYDLGGPDVVSFDELMQRMHMVLHRTAASPPVRHLPARPAIMMLSVLEGVMLPLLPLTAGQIYPFINDAVAAPGPLHDHLPPQQGLEQMLAALSPVV